MYLNLMQDLHWLHGRIHEPHKVLKNREMNKTIVKFCNMCESIIIYFYGLDINLKGDKVRQNNFDICYHCVRVCVYVRLYL